MKKTAEIILVVVNNQTRGIASMVEAAELIASGRDVVLVLVDFKAGDDVGGTLLDKAEMKDLNRGRAYLADVASRHGIDAFASVDVAVDHIISLYRGK